MKSRGRTRTVTKNIDARSDGYSFRVRMKIGEINVSETFCSLDEAVAYRDLLRAGRATDANQERVLRAKAEQRKSAVLTVEKLLRKYETDVSSSKKGFREERYTIGRLCRISWFAKLPVFAVDAEVIDRLKSELMSAERSLSPTTVRKYLMLISHMYKIAVVRRWCKEVQNPVRLVELPRPERMRTRRFDSVEFNYLCVELAKSKNPAVLPFFEFLVETACRRGEALRLRRCDVDLTNRTALLRDTKNGDDRIIGLSSRAAEIVSKLVGSQSGAQGREAERQVFNVTIGSIRAAFEAAKKRARDRYVLACSDCGVKPKPDFLQDVRLHDGRREATSRMFEKGLDLMEVASQTGHKTLSMLRGYTALRAANLAKRLG